VGIAGLVTVGHDDDLTRSGECLNVRISPLARTAGVAGGDNAGPLQGLYILLSLDYVDDAPAPCRRDHLGQPVEHPTYVAEFPLPPVGTIRATLSEAFIRPAQNLEQQSTALVGVVVGSDHGGLAGPIAVVGSRRE